MQQPKAIFHYDGVPAVIKAIENTGVRITHRADALNGITYLKRKRHSLKRAKVWPMSLSCLKP